MWTSSSDTEDRGNERPTWIRYFNFCEFDNDSKQFKPTLAYSIFSTGIAESVATKLLTSSFAIDDETLMNLLLINLQNDFDLLLIVSSCKGPNVICAGFHRRRITVMASGSVICCVESPNSCTMICEWDRNCNWAIFKVSKSSHSPKKPVNFGAKPHHRQIFDRPNRS